MNNTENIVQTWKHSIINSIKSALYRRIPDILLEHKLLIDFFFLQNRDYFDNKMNDWFFNLRSGSNGYDEAGHRGAGEVDPPSLG